MIEKFLTILLSIATIAVVIVAFVALSLIIPGIVYWLMGFVTDNEAWRFGFALAAFIVTIGGVGNPKK